MMHKALIHLLVMRMSILCFPGTVIRVGRQPFGKWTVKTGDFTISYCHLSVPYVHSNDYVDALEHL